MRKQVGITLQKIMEQDKDVILLTGDLIMRAFENIRDTLPNRLINAGVAEQNMVSVAAGLTYSGFKPWVYSIAPFVSLKTVEQLRNDVDYMETNVKIVGNGGGYGYGLMGNTHHLLEDIALFSNLYSFKNYVPAFNEDIEPIVYKMYRHKGPCYLRLGLAPDREDVVPYAPTREIKHGSDVTIITLGPLIHNALSAAEDLHKAGIKPSIWVITEVPIHVTPSLVSSIKKTKKVVVAEECTKHGGIGQQLAYYLQQKGILLKHFTHLYAKGYPSRLYGSQIFHQSENMMDAAGIAKAVKTMF